MISFEVNTALLYVMSNTKRSVKGNDLFSILITKVFCRKFDGIIRLIGFDINL